MFISSKENLLMTKKGEKLLASINFQSSVMCILCLAFKNLIKTNAIHSIHKIQPFRMISIAEVSSPYVYLEIYYF